MAEGEHLLLAINGENSGPIEWPAKTLESAKREGYTLNAEGFVTPVSELRRHIRRRTRRLNGGIAAVDDEFGAGGKG